VGEWVGEWVCYHELCVCVCVCVCTSVFTLIIEALLCVVKVILPDTVGIGKVSASAE